MVNLRPRKTDFSVSNSSTHPGHQKISSEEDGILSQDSPNPRGHAAEHQVCNSDSVTSMEIVAGSHISNPIVLSDPTPPPVRNETVPLSGNPYFTTIITKSHVEAPFQMAVPHNFHSYLPDAPVSVVLSCQSKTWEVTYHGEHLARRFNSGWKQFAVDNDLRIGDGCVFELIDASLRFQVQIISGEVPDEALRSRRSRRTILTD